VKVDPDAGAIKSIVVLASEVSCAVGLPVDAYAGLKLEAVEATRAMLLIRISPMIPFSESQFAVFHAYHSPIEPESFAVAGFNGRLIEPLLLNEAGVNFTPLMNIDWPLESFTYTQYNHSLFAIVAEPGSV